MTDDTFEAVTLLIRGTAEASEVDGRYPISKLAATLGVTMQGLASRFSRFYLPSLRDIQVKVRLLCILHRRDSLARRFYNHHYTLTEASGAGACTDQHSVSRFLRRSVRPMQSSANWIVTADFADVAQEGARFLFEPLPDWAGFHVTRPNIYGRTASRAPRCAECCRPLYGKERKL